ncbi:heparinase II/III family protein [Anaerocolumna sp. AGMB13020]|uniref:heparinase II/III domain-containing protein n=1 Tax=Anaerocolumna sp. AGMB13020 TaxID=3081750 RepID=UPI002953029E|nr:heparinase II/III family protein [Anaerocolumna sp. AGMB13020]WOO37730.1 heparinase II/III family protein [Anaerocolumna sp. AGMB13020]
MKIRGWECSEVTLKLRKQIDDLVLEAMDGCIPQLPFSGYMAFVEKGSRRESEAAYFERRKQLAAFCLYLQYHKSTESNYKKALNYFEELLWSVIHEFTWCVMAHLPQDKNKFLENPETQIDLFAAETGETLAEILNLHANILPPFLVSTIRNRITERIFEPFLTRNWWWETVHSNWCSVCCGSVGMTALLLTEGELRDKLLQKVDQGLVNYINSFGPDGACEEGIGYWVYGFGYYIYYITLRKEMDPEYHQQEELHKIKKIAEFPRIVQMSEKSFVPFSDVAAKSYLPTGLLSCLNKEYGVETPACLQITPFDFDNGYRFAHISRNLWWTDKQIFRPGLRAEATYLPDRQWLLQREKGHFFAVKGGNNREQHNHNDAGSFVLAINGEQFLADFGAGCYTADYFGEKRYEFIQTRSRYHNLPVVNGREQLAGMGECRVEQVSASVAFSEISMELGTLYGLSEVKSLKRSLTSDLSKHCILLQDSVSATEEIVIEEGFVSFIEPKLLEEGEIILEGREAVVTLSYDNTLLNYSLEELSFENHFGEQITAYRIGLEQKEKKKEAAIRVLFHF